MKFASRVLVSSPIEYGLCCDEADFRKTLKKLGLPLEEQPYFCGTRAVATTHYFDGAQGCKDVIIVCLGDTSGYTVNEVNSILVYEAVHVFQHIKKMLWETCNIDSGYEFESYSIQSISYNLMSEWENYELKQYEGGLKAKEKAKAAKKAEKTKKKAEE